MLYYTPITPLLASPTTTPHPPRMSVLCKNLLARVVLRGHVVRAVPLAI